MQKLLYEKLYEKLYEIIWWLILPLALLRLRWRARRLPAYARRWQQRLAIFQPQELEALQGIRPMWIHAVSVGESVVAVAMIEKLLLENPQVPIVVTNMTPTGSAWISDKLGERVTNLYAPYDHPWVVKNFLQQVRPRLLVLIETEIWPTWLQQAQQASIPVLLINGRLSERSATRYARVDFWSRPMFAALTFASMQAHADAERIKRLGVPAEKVAIVGNIKCDLQASAEVLARAQFLKRSLGKRPIWVAASTHAGEEELLLAVHRQLLQQLPQALLILVPRHPDRFAQVAESLSDWSWQRFSETQLLSENVQVLLGDVMGQLLLFYGAADAAVIGGSFVPVGGHNMLEAMAMGAPTIIGPHVFNFQTLTADLLAQQALLQVQSADELLVPLQQWLSHPASALPQIKQASAFMQSNRGATEKNFQLLQRFLSAE
jgi:3-deoxy-D-manno-octulosonic-acid transferase